MSLYEMMRTSASGMTSAENVTDAPSDARAIEAEAIAKSIELMEAAQRAGAQSRETIVALNFLRQLWSILIDDLASPHSAHPPMMRARIISIGLSIMRGAQDIRMGRADDFTALINVSRLVQGGLA